MPCAGVIIKAKIDKEKISRYTIDWQSINTKVNNLRKLIYRASANGTIILARNLQNLMLKSNVNKLLAINQEKICNYTSIFEIIEYKTFKYLFTAFSVVSILIFSYVSEASGYAAIQRNTHSLELELMPSKLDELIGEIRELNNQTESIIKSSESFREARYKKSMDELELFLETLEKLPYLYDTEDQGLNADTESCMALHRDFINNMENWQIADNTENLLLLDDRYSLNLEDISTCGTSKENSESGISEESIQLTNATQSKESETSESIDLEQDTQLIPNNSETPASNIDISDKKVIEQIEKSIFKATIDQQHKIVNVINHFIRNTRLDTSIDIIKTTAIAAGNEASNIQRGVWMHGIYGVNNQGLVDNIKGYTGISKGGSIGFDAKIENDIIGVVYSNVHSVLKFKNNRNKEVINSYIISIYGQKELPKNFVAQALISVAKNFIKDKITYSFNNAKFKSNLKHRNYTSNLEGVLNYNHLTKNNVIITPNIGLRYGKSRDGVYNETGISVQEISLTMKENNILSGIVGTKVKIPLQDVLKFNNLGLTMHGSMEHNFNEKTQRVNIFTQDYMIPKQPKTAYNLGASIMGDIKNTNISLEYNYYGTVDRQEIKFRIRLRSVIM